MAEFIEVLKQKHRMCDKYFGHCMSCPLNAFTACANPKVDVLPAYEAVIMGWAKNNPEPKYPTWIDWQQKTFPKAKMTICPKQYVSYKESGCSSYDCSECIHQPIPEEIAVKLGLQKGETNV